MGTERENELAELYALFKINPGYPELLFKNLSTKSISRIKVLLGKHTTYKSLPRLAKTAFVLALSHGATIDQNGLLIVNTPASRTAVGTDKRMKFLPREAISPQTDGLANLKIFEPRERQAVKGRAWNTKGLSPSGWKGRTGRWPSRRRG